ncbi:MAG: DUF4197 domain-containing protein [Rhodocyclaceae bacterium]|nr:DUF4197 domain-containing protein [Rhodocyclaceae bacterium]
MRAKFGIFLGLFIPAFAWAISLSDFTDSQATDGLRQTLTQSATQAVASLGKKDGFLGNPQVRIPLPENLAKVESLLRTLGMGAQADELVTTMNRAAESAVSEARPLLVDAVKKMSVKDAKNILTGGDDAATQYFKTSTGDPLRQKFRPIAVKAVGKLGLAQRYNALADKAGKFGLHEQSVEDYVTDKSLDGLWLIIAQQEKALRQDPVGAAGSLARKILGVIK